jgi:hypothetical protein
MDTVRLIPCPHTDIITEFADVEIFLISVDSLLLELCAHDYHNWTLGGQTIVISEQVLKKHEFSLPLHHLSYDPKLALSLLG